MIEKEEILKIAKLAKLHIKEDGIEKLQKEFSNILDMFKELQDLNCDDSQPINSTESLVLNPDKVNQDCLKEDLFRNVEKTVQKESKELSYYIVPKVLEH